MDEGVLIARVVPNSPAARAGFREGDIIVAFDGRPIKSMAEVQKQLRKRAIASSLDVTIVRGRNSINLTIKLGEVPA